MKEDLAKSLINFLRDYVDVENDNIYSGRYNGVVEDNNDPEQNGRCRVRTMGLYDDIPTELLPWALPDFSFCGTKKGSFIVPEIGTVVNVYYDDNDIYQPRYFSKTLDLTNQNFDADKSEDYPDSMIFWETKDGDYFKFNRLKGEATFRTHNGVLVKIFQSGSIEISNDSTDVGDTTLNLRGDFNINNPFGNINLYTNNFNISGYGDLNIVNNGSTKIHSLNNAEIMVNGDCDVVAGGNTKVSAKDTCTVESMNCNILSNNIKFDIATGPISVVDIDGEPDVENTTQSAKFDMTVGSVESTPILLVEPDVTGGPFNTLLFDPLTGAIHQGRHLTGAAIVKNDTIKQAELQKQIAVLKYNEAKEISDAVNEITTKYNSITETTKMAIAGPTGIAFTKKKMKEEIDSAKSAINEKYTDLIEQLEKKYGNNLKSPIFGTNKESDSPQKNSADWEKKKPLAELEADKDITNKTTYYDIIGPSGGFINQED